MGRSHQFGYPGSPAPAALPRQRSNDTAATILDTNGPTSHAAADCYCSHFQMQRIRS